MLLRVNAVLKRNHLKRAAAEFRYLAQEECDRDAQILISLATRYVTITKEKKR